MATSATSTNKSLAQDRQKGSAPETPLTTFSVASALFAKPELWSLDERISSAPKRQLSVRPRTPGALHGRTVGSVGEGNASACSGNENHARHVDYEYERAGTASIFMFAEPLAGWRQATAREHRTKSDWALEVAAHLDGRFADCEKITLVCDNLNTHTKGAFYEVFSPEVAREYVRRIEFCYTPKHGSWLNIAEKELSCMTSQCLSDRRIGELAELQEEIGAWSIDVTATRVEWQMRIDDARCKLIDVYPKILV